MTRRRSLTRSAAILTAIAATVPALAAVPAVASTAAPAASTASTAAGDLIGTLAYRGAEHPYLVGNLADAGKRFGPASPQAKAATAALVANVTSLTHQLAGNRVSRARPLRAGLLARDRAEVAYAAAVVAAHRAGFAGTTGAESRALAALDHSSIGLAAAVHAAVPAVSVALAKTALAALDAGDVKTLKAAALGLPSQFAGVELGSQNLAAVMVAIGQKKSGRPAATSKAVVYRAALEAAFTQHVYQTGLFGEAVLVDGPGSAAAVAAHKADGLNTLLIASLLRDIGAGVSTRSIWNGHITGYSDYLAHLATGTGSVAAADRLFASYETGITTQVHKAVPTIASAKLKATFTMHVTGTLAVFRLEKAGSPALYPTAIIGANMFAEFATSIAKAQTKVH